MASPLSIPSRRPPAARHGVREHDLAPPWGQVPLLRSTAGGHTPRGGRRWGLVGAGVASAQRRPRRNGEPSPAKPKRPLRVGRATGEKKPAGFREARAATEKSGWVFVAHPRAELRNGRARRERRPLGAPQAAAGAPKATQPTAMQLRVDSPPTKRYKSAARGVAQSGSAFGSGPKGRRFKSSRPDLSTRFLVPDQAFPVPEDGVTSKLRSFPVTFSRSSQVS